MSKRKFSVIILCLLFSVILSGCGGKSPEQVVESYLSSDVKGRLDYVINPEEVKPLMAKHYDGEKIVWSKEKLNEVNLKHVKNEDLNSTAKDYDIVLRENKENKNDYTEYFIKKVDGEWKINWEASIPYNEVSLIEFNTNRSSTPIDFRGLMRLSDYYNYDYMDAQSEYYSIQINEPYSNEYFYAYIEKTSPEAEEIFKYLKDGQLKPMILSIFIPENFEPNGNVAVIKELVSKSWIE
jgi:hypothetical protein